MKEINPRDRKALAKKVRRYHGLFDVYLEICDQINLLSKRKLDIKIDLKNDGSKKYERYRRNQVIRKKAELIETKESLSRKLKRVDSEIYTINQFSKLRKLKFNQNA